MRIVADTSAFAAILFHEQDVDGYRAKLLEADRILISAVSVVETHMIAHARSGAQGVLLWHRLLNHPNIEVVPVDRVMTEAATEAYERFGKGYHPARLNFGDLFSYALAKTHNLPLLYKGNDFAHTDIVSVLSA